MIYDFFLKLVEILISFVKDLGYLGIFIGMAIESSFFPLPSEVILIPAGALIARGEMNFFLVFSAALLGSIIGAWIIYFLALFLGRRTIDSLVNRYGKFFFLNKDRINKTDKYFKEHGEVTTFVGRMIFVVRHLISIPAGFSRMNFFKFTLYTALGAGLWAAILIYIGYFFGGDFHPVMKIATAAIIGICIIILVVYYLIKKKRKRN